MDNIVKCYPRLVSTVTIGHSFENRLMYVLKVRFRAPWRAWLDSGSWFLVSRTQPSHFWRRQLVRTSLASGRRVRWGHLCSGWELFWHRVPCFCLLWMELEGAHPFPSFGRKAGSRRGEWTSLVDQWLGIHLPMQGTWVQSLVREDSTSWGVAKPVPHNYWADTPRACVPQLLSLQLLKPVSPRALLCNKRSHHN